MLNAIIFVMGGANGLLYIHTRFPSDKYKLHHQKLMETVLWLVVSWWHVPPPSACTFLIITGSGDA